VLAYERVTELARFSDALISLRLASAIYQRFISRLPDCESEVAQNEEKAKVNI